MKKPLKITKETMFKIIEDYNNSINTDVIAAKIGSSQGFVSHFIRAYHGNKKYFNMIAKKHRELIIDNSPFYNRKTKLENQVIFYECKILFGLITLTFKPKYKPK